MRGTIRDVLERGRSATRERWDSEALGPRYESLTVEQRCAEYFVDGGPVKPEGYDEYEARQLARRSGRR